MKTIVLLSAMLFISMGIKAQEQEPAKKESAPPPAGTSQERSINEKGVSAKPHKSSSNANAKTTPAPAEAPPPPPPPPPKDEPKKPE